MIERRDSGWRYYLPTMDETAEDAEPIHVYRWQSISDAEDAATFAAEDDWDSRDGWEAGLGVGPNIVVISPDGHETLFETEREAEVVVVHHVRKVFAK